VRVADGELAEVGRGEPGRPDVVVDTDPDTLDDVLGDDHALTAAIESGRLTVVGDERLARNLFAAISR
jgi:putative sterol carrier protein